MDNVNKVDKWYESRAQSWCLKQGIIIYVIPTTPLIGAKLQIIVNYKGSKYPGERLYEPKGGKAKDPKWWIEVMKLYVYYFEKENEKKE